MFLMNERIGDIWERFLSIILFIPDEILTWLLITRTHEKRNKRTDVAGETEILTEWTSVVPPDPIVVENEQQFLELYVDCFFLEDEKTEDFEFWLTNGEKLDPSVKLLDKDGNEFALEVSPYYSIEWADPMLHPEEVSFIEFTGKLPSDKRFVNILIKNSSPFVCKKISWFCYTPLK